MERRAAWLALLPLLTILFVLGGCPGSSPARKPGPVRVVATIPPLAGLVRPLLPPGGTVRALIPPTRSEHGYELSAADVAALADADVVVYVGLGLDPQVEAFVAKHPSPVRRGVCFASVTGIEATPDGPGAHDEDGHHHGGTDPHLWLDPDLCIKLVPALAQAIGAAGDAGALAGAQAAGEKLVAQIRAFDEESKAKLRPFAGQAIVTHHAAWGRLAGHYGLSVAAVIRPIETAEETSGAVDAVIDAIRTRGIRSILIEPQFSDKAARRIAQETGVRIGHLDPLGDGDWFTMMRANIDALAEALGH